MSEREIVSTEPATGAVLWRGPSGDVETEVGLACEAWPNWAAQPLSYRAEALRRFANVVRARSEDMADLIARETGKPLWEARVEVEAVTARVDVAISAFAERTGQRRLDSQMNVRLALRHKPHGVLAVLTPYAQPAEIPSGHIVPALLAGNTVVFKPSEKTSATAAMLVECYRAAGIPEGCVRLLVGDAQTGAALSAHPRISGLLFTGSAPTGLTLNRQFAEHPEKVLTLEMGGNNPMVVWDTPDLYTAAVLVVQSAFTSAGQRCTAARRLIVEERLAEPLLEQVDRLIDRLILGAPHDDPAPFMGPVIDNDTADRLTEAFLNLSAKGGRPLRYLERPVEGRPFLTPALIDMTDAPERPDTEWFGPLLQVVRVASFEAAIAEANNTRYGLSAALVSQDPRRYDSFWANVRAGIVNWNRPTIGASPKAPFGGVGWSGNHRPDGLYAADYCAYPVVSSEAEQGRALIGVGLRDG